MNMDMKEMVEAQAQMQQAQNNQVMMQYYQSMMEMQMYMMDPCNQVNQEPNHNKDHPFTQSFLRAEDYDHPDSVIVGLPHLKSINQPLDINKIGNATFFIIRSTNDDDIHKAIKYQQWASSVKNNQILNEAYLSAKAQGQKTYLIFSVVKSGQFCAVAEMTSQLQVDYSFRFWWEANKYFGTFKLEFLFVKDLKDKLFSHLKEESQENKQVFKLRDSTRICVANGKAMLTIFSKQASRPNIFETFAYMDRREDILRGQRQGDVVDNATFNEKAAQYRENKGNPSAFKKRPTNFNSQGLYGNPFYQKKQIIANEDDNKIESKFFIKDKEQTVNRPRQKQKRRVKRDNYYEAGQHGLETVEVHYIQSDDEQKDDDLQVNDNKSRPVIEKEPEQEQQ